MLQTAGVETTVVNGIVSCSSEKKNQYLKEKKKQFLSFTCDYGSSVFLLSLETITSVRAYGTSAEASLCKSNKHNDNRDGGRRTKIIC